MEYLDDTHVFLLIYSLMMDMISEYIHDRVFICRDNESRNIFWIFHASYATIAVKSLFRRNCFTDSCILLLTDSIRCSSVKAASCSKGVK